MKANTTASAPAFVSFLLNGTANWTKPPHEPMYDQAGQYNVTFVVTDGKAATNVTLVLNVTGSTFEQSVASGTPDLPCPQCSTAGANTGAGYRAGVHELDSWFVEIPGTSVGQMPTDAFTRHLCHLRAW